MSNASLPDAVRQLRRMVLRHDETLSDSGLLKRFLTRRDDAALEALVHRHGPMVLGVCRRLLRHEQDAEDAFQATFILLVRKAASLERSELLGNWLYGVAYRMALEARTLSARRQAREMPTATPPERESPQQEDWSHVRPVLDEELSRLPEKYRSAVVLCDLEGKTRKEAARQLRLAEGTLNGRLTTAHRLLAQRLSRRGVTLAMAALFLSLRAASAGLPPGLTSTTMRAVMSVAAGNAAASGMLSLLVAALTKGMVKTMMLSRLKMVSAMLLAVGLVLAGTGGLLHRAQAEKPATTTAVPHLVPSLADKKPGGPFFSGTAKEVDNKKGIITLSIPVGKGKESEEKTFTLPKDVKVFLADNLTKDKPTPTGVIGDVTIGTFVSIQLAEDKKTVIQISARGPTLWGGLKEVNADKGTITLSTKDSSGASEITLKVEEGAKILFSDGLKKDQAPKVGKLSDLKAGTLVSAQLTVDRKRVLGIQPRGKSVHGTLKAIAKDKSSVKVEYKDGMLVEKNFTLSKDARVDENAAVGDRVNVRLSVFDEAIAVEVQAVDKDKKK